MAFFPSGIWIAFKKSKWYGLAILIAWVIYEAILHAIFSWFNGQIAGLVWLMNIIETILKWTANNAIEFLIMLGIAYCLIVIIGAQLSKEPETIAGEEPAEPESLPVLEILSHKNGNNVNFRDIVSGTIGIPDSSVQVFVYSGNDYWYRQREVFPTNNYWEVECQFGDENSSLPSQYKIAAISPAQKVPRRIAVLPSGPGITQSKEVRVVRSS
ncbi:MAG: hypothetical protein ACLQLE_15350 [Desulfobaccales bacterium]